MFKQRGRRMSVIERLTLWVRVGDSRLDFHMENLCVRWLNEYNNATREPFFMQETGLTVLRPNTPILKHSHCFRHSLKQVAAGQMPKYFPLENHAKHGELWKSDSTPGLPLGVAPVLSWKSSKAGPRGLI